MDHLELERRIARALGPRGEVLEAYLFGSRAAGRVVSPVSHAQGYQKAALRQAYCDNIGEHGALSYEFKTRGDPKPPLDVLKPGGDSYHRADVELTNFAINYGYSASNVSSARMVPWGRCMDKLAKM